MICPVCHKQMTERDFGGTKVDVCQDGCKGIWFDWQELQRLDERNEGLGSALEEALSHPRVNDRDRGRLTCPKCGIPMARHAFSAAKEVNVDECYNCGGFFLDSGELRPIRENHMTEAEEEAYAEKLLRESPVYSQALSDQAKERQRVEALRHYTRFMRLGFFGRRK